MHILGLVARTHDFGLGLLIDGVPTLILEEERFNREKHTRKFPFLSLKAAFDGKGLDEIDVITTPWHMASLRQAMFWAVAGHLPASLNLLAPSAASNPVNPARKHADGASMGIVVALRH